LPGGNDPLISTSWQPVPGATGAQIYPLIRKMDTISSNSYLIQISDVILLRRIDMQPLLSDVVFTFSSTDKHIVAAVDHDDLTDLVTGILEDLVGTGSGTITVQVGRSEDATLLTISGTGCTATDGTGKGGGFLKRLIERAGGSLLFSDAGGLRRYVITVRPAG